MKNVIILGGNRNNYYFNELFENTRLGQVEELSFYENAHNLLHDKITDTKSGYVFLATQDDATLLYSIANMENDVVLINLMSEQLFGFNPKATLFRADITDFEDNKIRLVEVVNIITGNNAVRSGVATTAARNQKIQDYSETNLEANGQDSTAINFLNFRRQELGLESVDANVFDGYATAIPLTLRPVAIQKIMVALQGYDNRLFVVDKSSKLNSLSRLFNLRGKDMSVDKFLRVAFDRLKGGNIDTEISNSHDLEKQVNTYIESIIDLKKTHNLYLFVSDKTRYNVGGITFSLKASGFLSKRLTKN